MTRTRAAAHRASSGRCSRSRRSSATSPTTTRTSPSRCCGSRTCSATTSTRRSRSALRRPVVPEIFGFDPRVQFVHEDDVVGALMYATTQRRARRLQRRRRRQPAVERGVHDRRQAAASRCRRCSRLGGRADAAARPLGPPARGADAAALRPHDRQRAASSAPASATSTRARARSRRSRRACASSGAVGDKQPDVSSTSARSRPSSGTRPPSYATGVSSRWNTFGSTKRDGVAVVTLVDLERRNAMTAPMVLEIVETFDAARSERRRSARSCSRANRRRSAPAPTSSSLGALAATRRRRSRARHGRVDLRRVPPGAALAAADGRRGQRPRGRRGHEPRARVRRAPRRARRRGSTPGSCSIGLHPGGGHTWMLDRAVGPQAAAAIVLFGEPIDGARAVEIGLAWRCHPDDELLDRGARRSRPARPRSRRRCRRATKQTAARRCRGSPTSTPRSRPRSTSDLVARPRLVQREP